MGPAKGTCPKGLWLLLGLAATALVLSGVVQGGMGWDEPEQIHAGVSYTHWFTDGTNRLSDATIRQFWTWDPAHPPLGKLLMGLMVRLLGGVLGPLSAARVASALALGATIALLSAWTDRAVGPRPALLAGVSLLFFPRVFGAAHFASLDTPMMLAWLVAVVTFERALRSSPGQGELHGQPARPSADRVARAPRRSARGDSTPMGNGPVRRTADPCHPPAAGRKATAGSTALLKLRSAEQRRIPSPFPGLSPAALLAGVSLGLALLTKLNALFLPFVLWPWALIRYRRRAVGPILVSLVLGSVIFLVGWPWLYHDTVHRVWAYVAEKAGRPVLPVWYLGRAYLTRYAPWHYPLVMLAVTTPVGLLAGAVAGLAAAGASIRRPADPCHPPLVGFAELSLVNLAGILLVACLPWAPKYDGVRLFLPAFPFLALLAGIGLDAVYRQLGPKKGAGIFFPGASTKPAQGTAGNTALLKLRSAEQRVARYVARAAEATQCGAEKNPVPFSIRRRLLLVAGVAFMLVQGWGLIGAWPFHLTFYNMMVGGRSGAERLGFETMYWGEAFDRESWRALESAVGRIAEADSPSSEHEKPRVSFVGVAREVPEYLQTRGYLTREFVPVRPDANESDYLVVVRSQGWLARDGRLDLLQSGALAKALFVRRHRSMPLCWILSADAEHRSRRPETER